ncbi:hypothetical protein SAMN04487905_104357 [Actinopolyspora xinjiangensis]|uniref:DUF1365 domain-containing protein n=1 Tax=Actinopolyspora xinjiangensis TaxID=405564 RepID=A0A1H0T6P5_9ACTN|nr:DUF1365 domain-containing protein [Actinopolyspora xinjiangensis]SDP49410.1 hypothetical protein SAMN04487905_104357 [Actinopolyspora xinjiangensis]
MRISSTAALYDVTVGHTRHTEPSSGFRHRLYTWLVDLDELPVLPRPLRPFARFEARDHLGSPRRSIRANLDSWLSGRGVDLGGGRVLMLAHARVLGYVFNPVTFYWCHRPDGVLECVVAEVHNTYGERHCYLLRPDELGRATTTKRFHVSPFLPLRGSYEMRLDCPGERVDVWIRLRDEAGEPLLTAEMRGHRVPAKPRRLLRMLLRRPLVPQRVAALIRAHGVSLWLRGASPSPHTPHVHQEGVR